LSAPRLVRLVHWAWFLLYVRFSCISHLQKNGPTWLFFFRSSPSRADVAAFLMPLTSGCFLLPLAILEPHPPPPPRISLRTNTFFLTAASYPPLQSEDEMSFSSFCCKCGAFPASLLASGARFPNIVRWRNTNSIFSSIDDPSPVLPKGESSLVYRARVPAQAPPSVCFILVRPLAKLYTNRLSHRLHECDSDPSVK